MKTQLTEIKNIPAVIYGEKSNKCYLFLHGRCGCKEEALEFARIVNPEGWQVLAIDLPGHGERKEETEKFNPWSVVPELQTVSAFLKLNWTVLCLRANSIGAWFAMQCFAGSEFEKSLFVSPILDMNILIENMMKWAGVSLDRLKDEKEIATDFGESLSYRYYEYAREHPITSWNCRTEILYASLDNLTSRQTADSFTEKFHAGLTVMDGGEHWFHTPQQIEFLEKWTRKMTDTDI